MPFASAVNHVDPNGFRTDDWRDTRYFELSKLHIELGIIPLEVAQEKKGPWERGNGYLKSFSQVSRPVMLEFLEIIVLVTLLL